MALFGGPMKVLRDRVGRANFNLSVISPVTPEMVAAFEQGILDAALLAAAKGHGTEVRAFLASERSDHPTWKERDIWNGMLERVAEKITT